MKLHLFYTLYADSQICQDFENAYEHDFKTPVGVNRNLLFEDDKLIAETN